MILSVLYGCDDNYAPYTGISMTSLFENNKDVDEITVYLAGMNLSQTNVNRFIETSNQYERKLILLDTEQAVKRIKEYNCGSWNDSLAAWLRFFVLDQIPQTVDRLIWIDSDSIVKNGIEKILEYNISNAPLAAVCDCLSYRQRYRLGFKSKEPYYNSGVIVFNMQYFRDHGVIDKMMSHLVSNISKYIIPDQDMMNDFFRGRIYKLEPQYNMQCFLLAYNVDDYYKIYPWLPEAYYTINQTKKALRYPVIIHFFRFLGDYPWTQGKNYHPAKQLYEKWKSKSLWNDHNGSLARTERNFKIEKKLYNILPRRWFLRLFSWYTNKGLPKR